MEAVSLNYNNTVQNLHGLRNQNQASYQENETAFEEVLYIHETRKKRQQGYSESLFNKFLRVFLKK